MDCTNSCRIEQSPRPEPWKAWQSRAEELADWTADHLVNRDDAWGQYLPRAQRSSSRTAVTERKRLTRRHLIGHFLTEGPGGQLGLHTTSPAGTCRWIAIDIDQHDNRDPGRHRRNRKAAIALYCRVKQLGFQALLISSNGRGGYHLFVLFDKPVPSETAYRFGRWLVHNWEDLGFDEEPETFPKQPKLTAKCKLGNWLRLPGRHHSLDHYSRVWSGERWLEGNAAVQAILETQGCSPHNIPVQAFTLHLPEIEKQPQKRAVSRSLRLTAKQAASPIGMILSLLENVRPCNDQWSARCPAHNDRNNSLSVAEADDGRVLLCCHAGCSYDEILDELELSPASLFPRRRRGLARRRRTPNQQRPRRSHQ